MSYFSFFRKKDYSLAEDADKKLVDLSAYTTVFSRLADDISFYSYYTMQDGERLDVVSQKLYGTPEYYWTIPLINENLVNVYGDLPKDTPSFIEYLTLKYPGIALIPDGSETIAGKFKIGEKIYIQSLPTNKAIVIAKYPTQGYLQVEVEEGSDFPINTVYTIVGEESGDTMIILNNVPTYNAPAYHVNTATEDYVRWNAGGNVVPILIRELEIDRNIESSQIKVIRPRYITEVVKQFEVEMRKR